MIRSIVLAASAIALAFTVPASAAEVRIKVAGKSAAEVRAEIVKAASTVCWQDIRGEALAGYLYPACIRASVNDAVAMLKIAAEQADGSRWVAAFLQGLRPAERRGLTWQAIDFERNLIEISWQLQPLPYREAYDATSGFRVPDGHESIQVRGRWHLVRPKTSSGWRIAPMTPWMSSSLLAWREKAPENIATMMRYDVLGEFVQRAAEGTFTIPIARTFPLEGWRDALAVSQSGQARGKLVLLPGSAAE